MNSLTGTKADMIRFRDDLQAEYRQIDDIVRAFDERLLTIKGWGVTLSLASLGLGFQQNHYGLFLIATVSSVAFWLVEAVTKGHQMSFYPRMGEIEVIAYQLFRVQTPSGIASSPLINWSFRTAGPRGYRPRRSKRSNPIVSEPQPWPDSHEGLPPWLFVHVMLPHVFTAATGAVLFMLGLFGVFGPI